METRIAEIRKKIIYNQNADKKFLLEQLDEAKAELEKAQKKMGGSDGDEDEDEDDAGYEAVGVLA